VPEALSEATWRVSAGRRLILEVNVWSDGELTIENVI
jgi:hypothetical protein